MVLESSVDVSAGGQLEIDFARIYSIRRRSATLADVAMLASGAGISMTTTGETRSKRMSVPDGLAVFPRKRLPLTE
jgi:uncharacterized membrane protein